MKPVFLLAAAAAVSALSGCASTPVPESVANRTAAVEASQTDRNTITGSRLARQASDRNVRAAGNSSVRSDVDIKSLGNEVGARSN